nr:hypothetical protein [Mute swan feces associated toti-like virus 2]
MSGRARNRGVRRAGGVPQPGAPSVRRGGRSRNRNRPSRVDRQDMAVNTDVTLPCQALSERERRARTREERRAAGDGLALPVEMGEDGVGIDFADLFWRGELGNPGEQAASTSAVGSAGPQELSAEVLTRVPPLHQEVVERRKELKAHQPWAMSSRAHFASCHVMKSHVLSGAEVCSGSRFKNKRPVDWVVQAWPGPDVCHCGSRIMVSRGIFSGLPVARANARALPSEVVDDIWFIYTPEEARFVTAAGYACRCATGHCSECGGTFDHLQSVSGPRGPDRVRSRSASEPRGSPTRGRAPRSPSLPRWGHDEAPVDSGEEAGAVHQERAAAVATPHTAEEVAYRRMVNSLDGPAVRGRGHLGDHSISGEFMTGARPAFASAKKVQNFVRHCHSKVANDDTGVFLPAAAAFPCDLAVGNTLCRNNVVGPPNAVDVVHTFNRAHAVAAGQPLDITWTAPVAEDMLPLGEAADYFGSPGIVNSSQLANALPGQLDVDQNFARRFAEFMNVNLSRVDNSSFYASGVLLMQDVLAREAMGQVPVFAPGVLAVQYRGLNVPAAQQDQLIADLRGDLALQAFVFRRRDLDDIDLSVLAALASAAPLAPGPAGNISRGADITRPLINIVVYGAAVAGANPLPAPVMPSAAQIWVSLRKLANLRKERQMLVRGWVRAQCLWNGGRTQYITPAPANVVITTPMTALGETVRVDWPAPRDSNWVWRVLNIAPDLEGDNLFESDAEVLDTVTIGMQDRMGALAAAYMAVGAGTTWHMINIRGNELMACGAPNQLPGQINMSGEAIRRMVITELDACAARIFLLACGTVSLFGTVVVNPLCFKGPSWNAGLNHVPHFNPNMNNLMDFSFHDLVPYVVSPLCIGWAIEEWLDIWGISAGHPKYNLTEEVLATAIVGNQFWYASQGDANYIAYLKTRLKYRYISYGAMVLNVLHQQFAQVASYAMQFEVIHPVEAGTRNAPPIPVPAGALPMVPGLNTLVVGCIVSYRWDLEAAVAPMLASVAVGPGAWTMMSTTKDIPIGSAGINLPKKVVAGNPSADFADLDEIFGNSEEGPSKRRRVEPDVQGPAE